MANRTFTNFSSHGSLGATHDGPPLPSEARFACLPGCGLCCSYRVLVTEADRQRLRAVVADSQPWEVAADGERALRRVPGFCLYLDPQQRCTVYEHRPEQCRAYPYLWTTYGQLQLDVDFSCPGLGCGNPVEWRHPPVETTQRQAQREEGIRELQGLLRAQRRYAGPDVLVALGERALDKLAAIWPAAPQAGSSTLRVTQRQPLTVNAETPDDLTALWQGLSLAHQPVEKLLVDAAFIKRHFGHSRWNTQLSPEGELAVYRFSIADRVLHLEDRGGAHQAIPLHHAGRLPWQSEALNTRRAYLQRWLQRQLLVRLANSLAVASLMRRGHVAVCYLQFLLGIDHRLSVLASALALACEKEAIDRTIALEAIRGSDGLLRAWCERARFAFQ